MYSLFRSFGFFGGRASLKAFFFVKASLSRPLPTPISQPDPSHAQVTGRPVHIGGAKLLESAAVYRKRNVLCVFHVFLVRFQMWILELNATLHFVTSMSLR